MVRASLEPEQPTWRLGFCLAFSASLAGLGCGGSEFTSASAAGARDTGGASTDGGAASGGSMSSGGARAGSSSGGGPSGGSASGGGPSGGAASGCACPSGQYCREGSTDCFDCGDFARLRFDDPKELVALSAVGAGSLRFPRVGETPTDLFYRSAALGGQTLWHTTDLATSAGDTLDAQFPADSAPLLLTGGVSGFGERPEDVFNFVFDRKVEGGKPKLYWGLWSNGSLVVAVAPAPYNASGTNDSSMAVALEPGGAGPARAYWMTDRDAGAGLQLATGILTPNGPGGLVPLSVGSPGCAADQADLTPWITNDGSALVFSNTGVDDQCLPLGTGSDLQIALMDPVSGLQQPGSPALPISDVNSPGNDTDPSFSRDLCELYFASDRGGDGFDLYRARRR